MDKVFSVFGSALSSITDLGIKLIATTIVLQILFGSVVPFVGLDVVANIIKVINALGSQGLVGLAAAAVLYVAFTKK